MVCYKRIIGKNYIRRTIYIIGNALHSAFIHMYSTKAEAFYSSQQSVLLHRIDGKQRVRRLIMHFIIYSD
ncbi:hypothetical protein SDC9_206211 [bioreactor metagenome]|uniref:Uncharacterized protein n=1 Tax=bioreactor metagenome TaxID=1076179 RepID=A0A645J4Y4_9ZZZZ